MKYKRYWALIIAFMFVVSCGINGDLKRTAESRKQAMDNAIAKIEAANKKYTQWKGTPEYDKFERYEEMYNWDKKYDDALDEALSAKRIWSEIEHILKNNNPKDEGNLEKKIRQIDTRLASADLKSKIPNKEIGDLRQLMEDAPFFIKKADQQVALMKDILSNIQPVVDKAMEDSEKFGWNKEQDISNRLSKLQGMYDTADAQLTTAKAQQDADDINYAVMSKSLGTVNDNLSDLQKADTHTRKLMEELNQSYTKRLVDMKHEFTVTIGRTSWDNYYDFAKETDYEYSPRRVDEATYNYLSKQTGDIASGMRWVRPKIPSSMWDKLRINARERVPRNDDDAVFWVSSADIEYFHKYLLIENGKENPTHWIEVDEDEYSANLNNLGMDIESKPYGLYAFEVSKEAAPPGMDYVGNEKYGRWQKDSSGFSFWAFYGQYAFLNAMLGGNRYYYNDWNHWRGNYRGRSPYYGKNRDGSAVFGTSGSMVRTHPDYRSSTFARQGGIKSAPANIRSAAASARGRGPGGRGK